MFLKGSVSCKITEVGGEQAKKNKKNHMPLHWGHGAHCRNWMIVPLVCSGGREGSTASPSQRWRCKRQQIFNTENPKTLKREKIWQISKIYFLFLYINIFLYRTHFHLGPLTDVFSHFSLCLKKKTLHHVIFLKKGKK